MKQFLEIFGGRLTDDEKRARSKTDTILITLELLEGLLRPPFQRMLQEPPAVKAEAAKMLANGGIISGTITIGYLAGLYYVCDGQHRLRAFVLSGLTTGLATVTVCYVDSMLEMEKKFRELNKPLVTMKADDTLRAMELHAPALRQIRSLCPFVGYGNLRRNASNAILAMSAVIRAWTSSEMEKPGKPIGGVGTMAELLSSADVEQISNFLAEAHAAWGRDREYIRLWNMLNMTLCMWFYRRLVLTPYSVRVPHLTPQQFRHCLMELSADANYIDWLSARSLSDRDRTPAYNRIKVIFARRLGEELGHKVNLPQPEWARL